MSEISYDGGDGSTGWRITPDSDGSIEVAGWANNGHEPAYVTLDLVDRFLADFRKASATRTEVKPPRRDAYGTQPLDPSEYVLGDFRPSLGQSARDRQWESCKFCGAEVGALHEADCLLAKTFRDGNAVYAAGMATAAKIGRRQSEVDAAVRLGLDRYSCPIPLRDIPRWFGDGRLPALRDEILKAWRDQHA